MRNYVTALIAVGLLACAGTMTQDEADWRSAIDEANWEMCKQAFAQKGVATVHYDHQHGHNGVVYGTRREWAVRQDLGDNHCKMVLRDYWAEY